VKGFLKHLHEIVSALVSQRPRIVGDSVPQRMGGAHDPNLQFQPDKEGSPGNAPSGVGVETMPRLRRFGDEV